MVFQFLQSYKGCHDDAHELLSLRIFWRSRPTMQAARRRISSNACWASMCGCPPTLALTVVRPRCGAAKGPRAAVLPLTLADHDADGVALPDELSTLTALTTLRLALLGEFTPVEESRPLPVAAPGLRVLSLTMKTPQGSSTHRHTSQLHHLGQLTGARCSTVLRRPGRPGRSGHILFATLPRQSCGLTWSSSATSATIQTFVSDLYLVTFDKVSNPYWLPTSQPESKRACRIPSTHVADGADTWPKEGGGRMRLCCPTDSQLSGARLLHNSSTVSMSRKDERSCLSTCASGVFVSDCGPQAWRCLSAMTSACRAAALCRVAFASSNLPPTIDVAPLKRSSSCAPHCRAFPPLRATATGGSS